MPALCWLDETAGLGPILHELEGAIRRCRTYGIATNMICVLPGWLSVLELENSSLRRTHFHPHQPQPPFARPSRLLTITGILKGGDVYVDYVTTHRTPPARAGPAASAIPADRQHLIRCFLALGRV